eukprot:5302593-Ditylum_brightwellii.AAC.1
MHNCPSFGEGQGNGSSPSNWLFQVSTLLVALHSLCTGVRLFSVCKAKKAERAADAYVDNMGNTYVDKDKQKDETPTTICDSIQYIAQMWEQLLYGSGRELCPKKTFWWLIWWIWKDGKEMLATKSEVNINMNTMFGKEDTTTTIKRRNCTVMAKDLRVLVKPAGDYCPEFEQRKDISIQVTQHTKNASLSTKNAYKLYWNIWLPSMQYPLA